MYVSYQQGDSSKKYKREAYIFFIFFFRPHFPGRLPVEYLRSHVTPCIMKLMYGASYCLETDNSHLLDRGAFITQWLNVRLNILVFNYPTV